MKSKLPSKLNKMVDLVLFAGQSNMSGRGSAAEALMCDGNAGFEYKSVSNPQELVPIMEPFGLGEDREGALTDLDSKGKSKRTGSMVSALVDEYYKRSGHQIVAVSASKGGTATPKWKSDYAADAAQRLKDAWQFLEGNGISVERCFVVWCQGESDGDARRTTEEYMQNTKDIFEVFKAAGAEKCFLVQIGHYNYIDNPQERNGLTGAEWDACYEVIRKAQVELCKKDDRFSLVASFEPFRNEMKDCFHYKQGAYNEVGRTAGAKIAEELT